MSEFLEPKYCTECGLGFEVFRNTTGEIETGEATSTYDLYVVFGAHKGERLYEDDLCPLCHESLDITLNL